MAWLPTAKVIDLSQTADNLLAYIAANQTDALEWAEPGLDDFQKFYTNASGRLATQFPSLMILSQRVDTDLAGDTLDAALQLILEATISGSDADELVAKTKHYSKAVESMLLNVPSEVLMANAEGYHRSYAVELETELDILRGQQSPSAFLQIFQTRVVYRLSASGF